MHLAESYSFAERLGDFLRTTKRIADTGRVPRVQATYTVAIVDDDPSVRTALRRLLHAHGLETRVYASARDFLSSLSSGRPKCLLLDINMVEMSGLELQAELASIGARIPTIVTTAVRSEQLREQTLAAGAIDCLNKPVDSDALFGAIERAIGSD